MVRRALSSALSLAFLLSSACPASALRQLETAQNQTGLEELTRAMTEDVSRQEEGFNRRDFLKAGAAALGLAVGTSGVPAESQEAAPDEKVVKAEKEWLTLAQGWYGETAVPLPAGLLGRKAIEVPADAKDADEAKGLYPTFSAAVRAARTDKTIGLIIVRRDFGGNDQTRYVLRKGLAVVGIPPGATQKGTLVAEGDNVLAGMNLSKPVEVGDDIKGVRLLNNKLNKVPLPSRTKDPDAGLEEQQTRRQFLQNAAAGVGAVAGGLALAPEAAAGRLQDLQPIRNDRMEEWLGIPAIPLPEDLAGGRMKVFKVVSESPDADEGLFPDLASALRAAARETQGAVAIVATRGSGNPNNTYRVSPGVALLAERPGIKINGTFEVARNSLVSGFQINGNVKLEGAKSAKELGARLLNNKIDGTVSILGDKNQVESNVIIADPAPDGAVITVGDLQNASRTTRIVGNLVIARPTADSARRTVVRVHEKSSGVVTSNTLVNLTAGKGGTAVLYGARWLSADENQTRTSAQAGVGTRGLSLQRNVLAPLGGDQKKPEAAFLSPEPIFLAPTNLVITGFDATFQGGYWRALSDEKKFRDPESFRLKPEGVKNFSSEPGVFRKVSSARRAGLEETAPLSNRRQFLQTLVTGLGADAGIGLLEGEAPAAQKPAKDAPVPPVIPGLVGFGVETPGGRRGQVLVVTSLEDSGPGSLRAALAQEGPRMILFAASGVIRLKTPLDIRKGNVTIAGQTAGKGGISIEGAGIVIRAPHVVIQHLRVRVGDDPSGPAPDLRDAVTILGPQDPRKPRGVEGAHHVVIDHCSLSGSVDELLSVQYGAHLVTVSNSILSYALQHAGHPKDDKRIKGGHSKGILVAENAERVLFWGNLIAHAYDRNLAFVKKGAKQVAFVNNVAYNGGRVRLLDIGSKEGEPAPIEAAAVGNVFIAGADSQKLAVAVGVWTGTDPGTKVYVADNRLVGVFSEYIHATNFNPRVTEPSFTITGLKPLPGAKVEEAVLASAGAWPTDRDAVDVRVIEEVRSRTGRIINSQKEIGGWPTIRQNRSTFRMPASPNAVNPRTGYTNLEIALHAAVRKAEGSKSGLEELEGREMGPKDLFRKGDVLWNPQSKRSEYMVTRDQMLPADPAQVVTLVDQDSVETVWDASGARAFRVIRPETIFFEKPVHRLAFTRSHHLESANLLLAASGNEVSAFSPWDSAASRKQMRFDAPILGATVSSNERSVLAVTQRYAVKYDPKYPKYFESAERFVFDIPLPVWEEMRSHRFAFSPDRKSFLVADENGGEARIQNLEPEYKARYQATQGIVARIRPVQGRAVSVAYHPDGNIVVLGTDAGTVELWELPGPEQPGGEAKHIGSTIPGGAAILVPFFSRDGEILAAGDAAGVLRLFRWGEETKSLVRLSEIRLETAAPIKTLSFFPLGKGSEVLASAGDDGVVRFLDVSTGRELARRYSPDRGPIYSISFSPDGRKIAAGGQTVLALWDVPPAVTAAAGLEENVLKQVGIVGPNAGLVDALVREVRANRSDLSITPFVVPNEDHVLTVLSQIALSGPDTGVIVAGNLSVAPPGSPLAKIIDEFEAHQVPVVYVSRADFHRVGEALSDLAEALPAAAGLEEVVRSTAPVAWDRNSAQDWVILRGQSAGRALIEELVQTDPKREISDLGTPYWTQGAIPTLDPSIASHVLDARPERYLVALSPEGGIALIRQGEIESVPLSSSDPEGPRAADWYARLAGRADWALTPEHRALAGFPAAAEPAAGPQEGTGFDRQTWDRSVSNTQRWIVLHGRNAGQALLEGLAQADPARPVYVLGNLYWTGTQLPTMDAELASGTLDVAPESHLVAISPEGKVALLRGGELSQAPAQNGLRAEDWYARLAGRAEAALTPEHRALAGLPAAGLEENVTRSKPANVKLLNAEDAAEYIRKLSQDGPVALRFFFGIQPDVRYKGSNPETIGGLTSRVADLSPDPLQIIDGIDQTGSREIQIYPGNAVTDPSGVDIPSDDDASAMHSAATEQTGLEETSAVVREVPLADRVLFLETGGTWLRVALLDRLTGDILARVEDAPVRFHPVLRPEDSDFAPYYLEQVQSHVDRLLARAGLTVENVGSVVVATPGKLSSEVDGYVKLQYNLPFEGMNYKRLIAVELGVPDWRVDVDNDVKLAALAEAQRGRARGSPVLAYTTLSTGTNSGIWIRGSETVNTELGGYDAVLDGEVRGKVEDWTSGLSLAKLARARIREPGGNEILLMTPNGLPEEITGEHVGEAFARHNPLAVYLFGQSARVLGRAIVEAARKEIESRVDLSSITEIPWVIGGGVTAGNVDTPFPAMIQAAVNGAWADANFPTPIRVIASGMDGKTRASLGAAARAPSPLQMLNRIPKFFDEDDFDVTQPRILLLDASVEGKKAEVSSVRYAAYAFSIMKQKDHTARDLEFRLVVPEASRESVIEEFQAVNPDAAREVLEKCIVSYDGTERTRSQARQKALLEMGARFGFSSIQELSRAGIAKIVERLTPELAMELNRFLSPIVGGLKLTDEAFRALKALFESV